MNRTEHELELMRRYLEGVASLEETQELESLIVKDASVRQDFLRYTHLDAALAGVRRSQPTLVAPRRFVWLSWRPLAAAAAVFIALLGGVALWWSQQGVAVEVLQATSDVSAEWTKGSRVRLNEVKLVYGEVQLRLSSGVLLDVAAPVEMKFIDAMHVRLLHGRMSADVGDQGKGFTVLTDAGEVVDLGTRFGIEAERDGESRLAVFSGQVKVRTGAELEGNAFTTLNEGEALRFTKFHKMQRWPQVALAAEAMGLASQPKEGVLSEVRDNLGDEGQRPFYGVVVGGMIPGAFAFIDKPSPRWAPLPGDEFPDALMGADLIRMYLQFRHKQSYELTLTLREAARVFVLIDTTQTPPEWLAARFKKMPNRVRVGPGSPRKSGEDGYETGPDGRPYRWCDVWSAESSAGEFKLGPARTVSSETPPTMYGVAVKALTPKPPLSN